MPWVNHSSSWNFFLKSEYRLLKSRRATTGEISSPDSSSKKCVTSNADFALFLIKTDTSRRVSRRRNYFQLQISHFYHIAALKCLVWRLRVVTQLLNTKLRSQNRVPLPDYYICFMTWDFNSWKCLFKEICSSYVIKMRMCRYYPQ